MMYYTSNSVPEPTRLVHASGLFACKHTTLASAGQSEAIHHLHTAHTCLTWLHAKRMKWIHGFKSPVEAQKQIDCKAQRFPPLSRWSSVANSGISQSICLWVSTGLKPIWIPSVSFTGRHVRYVWVSCRWSMAADRPALARVGCLHAKKPEAHTSLIGSSALLSEECIIRGFFKYFECNGNLIGNYLKVFRPVQAVQS